MAGGKPPGLEVVGLRAPVGYDREGDVIRMAGDPAKVLKDPFVPERRQSS